LDVEDELADLLQSIVSFFHRSVFVSIVVFGRLWKMPSAVIEKAIYLVNRVESLLQQSDPAGDGVFPIAIHDVRDLLIEAQSCACDRSCPGVAARRSPKVPKDDVISDPLADPLTETACMAEAALMKHLEAPQGEAVSTSTSSSTITSTSILYATVVELFKTARIASPFCFDRVLGSGSRLLSALPNAISTTIALIVAVDDVADAEARLREFGRKLSGGAIVSTHPSSAEQWDRSVQEEPEWPTARLAKLISALYEWICAMMTADVDTKSVIDMWVFYDAYVVCGMLHVVCSM
jgi:hypothetical protein